jgi:lysyl-tRNA synthetase class 2
MSNGPDGAQDGAEQTISPSDQRAQRVHKMEQLRADGIDPYGSRVDNVTATSVAQAEYEKLEAELEARTEEPEAIVTPYEKVQMQTEEPEVTFTLAGRLMGKRIMGRSLFADLKDSSGRMQLFVQKNVVGADAFQQFKQLDLGDIITVTGTVFRTRMGEITLKPTSFRLLAKALRPLPEKWHGLTDVEQRYRQRYLDLATNEEVAEVFKKRIQIIRRIRQYLDSRGFLEVETPMMQSLAGGAAARPFKTHYNALDCPMYLRIAPELYLKRLLVGGFEKVYEINRNFRNEGLSRRHNPEFTMVEIYQAYSDCRGMMDLIEGLISTVAQDVLGSTIVAREDAEDIDLTPPWRRATYAELITERMGDDWYELPIEAKREKARAEGLTIMDDWAEHEITHEIYEKVIEHTLIQPTFVTRLPAFLVPLAKRCEDDPSVVDVYELEINGQEISPGYSELNDPIEQRSRFDMQLNDDDEHEVDRIDEDFLTAMEHGMPPAGGLGMGIDRLVMLLTGSDSIRDVILFPQMRSNR